MGAYRITGWGRYKIIGVIELIEKNRIMAKCKTCTVGVLDFFYTIFVLHICWSNYDMHLNQSINLAFLPTDSAIICK